MASHSSTLAWKIPWTEEPGRLQSMGSHRVGHEWATSLSRIGEGNGNPLQCSCLENPRDRGAWWPAVCGVAQSPTRLKWLSSSSRPPYPSPTPGVCSNLCPLSQWCHPAISSSVVPSPPAPMLPKYKTPNYERERNDRNILSNSNWEFSKDTRTQMQEVQRIPSRVNILKAISTDHIPTVKSGKKWEKNLERIQRGKKKKLTYTGIKIRNTSLETI